ncbi:MAG: hypothetical protein EOM17_16560, partial [Synergistales bacterium]|nr:hypothetical protein [Synergistales bacterium]
MAITVTMKGRKTGSVLETREFEEGNAYYWFTHEYPGYRQRRVVAEITTTYPDRPDYIRTEEYPLTCIASDLYAAGKAAAETEYDEANSKIKGKRGAPELRKPLEERKTKRLSALQRAYDKLKSELWMSKGWNDDGSRQNFIDQWRGRKNSRRYTWGIKQGHALAEKSGQNFDEHGSSSGDYLSTSVVDYVSPWDGSATAPYCDMGGEGLALIRITRTRVYAKSSKWFPARAFTLFLVGKNEAGTYFAHPVAKTCETVADAVQWIWSGRAKDIIARQGD